MSASWDEVLEKLRRATAGAPYAGRLYLVGGCVRDKVMGVATDSGDLDIVLEGDALAVAHLLYDAHALDHPPVVYPRFGTAMVMVDGRQVEIVSARRESYAPDSRKPDQVRPGTLLDDARRRDFTINTLLENLHTGEIVDPLGLALRDIEQGIIRTPDEPGATFRDDPLRMLRGIRFATRFAFQIEDAVRHSIQANAQRLKIVSAERIRDEFSKILMLGDAAAGLTLLKESGLLAQFAPELLTMVGVTQNAFHAFPVWEHTLAAVSALPADSSLTVRLATVLHDLGKPATRSVGADGAVHFYGHQTRSAEMARPFLARLKYPNDQIDAVVRLVQEHMRIGEYNASWSDAAVRRFIRDLGDDLEGLFTVHHADVAALAPDHRDTSRAGELRARIAGLEDVARSRSLISPLNGSEIMELLGLAPGREIGKWKDFLTNAVIEGRLEPGNRDAAVKLLKQQTGADT